jgi:hypothetical protein
MHISPQVRKTVGPEGKKDVIKMKKSGIVISGPKLPTYCYTFYISSLTYALSHPRMRLV